MDEISLAISVNLESSSSADNRPSSNALTRTVEQLIELLRAEGISATWIASDPSASELIGQALESDRNHEAALGVPSAWLNCDNGRSRFVTEFIARKQRIEAAGISLSTLAAEDGLPASHLELLVRRGITAILSGRPTSARLTQRDRSSGIVPIRYGLWQLPCDLRYRGGGWLGERLAARRICREVDRRTTTSVATHLVIDAPALAWRSVGKFAGLKTILRHIQRREREGTLQAGTVAQSIARITAPRAARSARSILRAA